MRLIDADSIKYTTLSNGGWGGPPEEVANKYDIDKMPTVDAVPVVHARWRWQVGRWQEVLRLCSKCGSFVEFTKTLGASFWKFCPYCGSKMDLEVE